MQHTPPPPWPCLSSRRQCLFLLPSPFACTTTASHPLVQQPQSHHYLLLSFTWTRPPISPSLKRLPCSSHSSHTHHHVLSRVSAMNSLVPFSRSHSPSHSHSCNMPFSLPPSCSSSAIPPRILTLPSPEFPLYYHQHIQPSAHPSCHAQQPNRSNREKKLSRLVPCLRLVKKEEKNPLAMTSYLHHPAALRRKRKRMQQATWWFVHLLSLSHLANAVYPLKKILAPPPLLANSC